MESFQTLVSELRVVVFNFCEIMVLPPKCGNFILFCFVLLLLLKKIGNNYIDV